MASTFFSNLLHTLHFTLISFLLSASLILPVLHLTDRQVFVCRVSLLGTFRVECESDEGGGQVSDDPKSM